MDIKTSRIRALNDDLRHNLTGGTVVTATDLRLANHWRRMRVRIFVASVLSRQIARVDQR